VLSFIVLPLKVLFLSSVAHLQHGGTLTSALDTVTAASQIFPANRPGLRLDSPRLGKLQGADFNLQQSMWGWHAEPHTSEGFGGVGSARASRSAMVRGIYLSKKTVRKAVTTQLT